MGTGSAWQTHSKGGSDEKATKEEKSSLQVLAWKLQPTLTDKGMEVTV
jgi:hypothetical protein